MKKAQGISVTTIIIAAIALIVMVVLIAIFAGKIGIWGQEVSEAQKNACESQGYQCVSGGCAENQAQIYGFKCPENKVCCRAV